MLNLTFFLFCTFSRSAFTVQTLNHTCRASVLEAASPLRGTLPVVGGASTSNSAVMLEFVLYTQANMSNTLYQHSPGCARRTRSAARAVLSRFI